MYFSFVVNDSVADPKWQNIVDFSDLKIKPLRNNNRTPIYFQTHFRVFISVHYCLSNVISRFLWVCGASRPQLHAVMWLISCLKIYPRSTSKIIGLATLLMQTCRPVSDVPTGIACLCYTAYSAHLACTPK